MSTLRNPLAILKLLDKSNCRECGENTCLAFAGAVSRGRRKIRECPKLDRETIELLSGQAEYQKIVEPVQDDYLKKLKNRITRIELASAAARIGARFSGEKLTIKVLGKDFSVDTKGNLYSDIHINPWVVIPFLNHVLYGKGLPVSGNWVSFRELKDGRERYPLFQKRCEEPMRKVADIYTGLFNDMVHIFNARQVERQFQSDISAVLHPFPQVPLMVCYWLPDNGLESSLNVFFDETADKNLDIGSVFTLGVGLAQMFERLTLRHGFTEVKSS